VRRPLTLILILVVLSPAALRADLTPAELALKQQLGPQTPDPIPLWPGKPPHALDNPSAETVDEHARIHMISEPTISPYLPPADKATGMAIIVCPGGGPRPNAPAFLVRNVTHMPIRIYAGENDPHLDSSRQLHDILVNHGSKPELIVLPNVGHDWPVTADTECTTWLLQHTRHRPDHFVFVADTDEHTGVWGVTMQRDPQLPEFECTITGNTVRIDSRGTQGLEVKLGSDRLKLTGNVVLVWNGKQAYEGPAKTHELGDGIELRR
jgi:hypothetical protein